MNIRDYLVKMGYTLISEEYYKKMKTWESWYKGFFEQFHRYSIYNGTDTITRTRASMNSAKMGCEYWANLLWNQDCYITVDSSNIKQSLSKRILKTFKRDNDNASQILINVVLEHNKFNSQFNSMCEKAFATGVGGIVVHDNTIDFVEYSGIHPLSYKNGQVESCAFSTVFSHIKHGTCIYLMIHVKQDNKKYKVSNKFFKLDNDNITEFTKEEFKSMKVQESFETNTKRFTILKPNIANNVDSNNPLRS